MISRRDFLGTSAAAAAGAAVTGPDALSAQPAPQDMPPSIARLSSRA